MEKEIPKLEEGEEIVYLTKAIPFNFFGGWCVFAVAVLFSMGIVLLIETFVVVNVIFSIIYKFVIILMFSIWGIYMWDDIERRDNILYYITTKRVIEIEGRGFLPLKPKQKEIDLDDIAFIERNNGLEIVQKGRNGELHYTGEETEVFTDLPKSMEEIKTMHFDLEGKLAKKIVEVIIKKFQELLPATQHPNLEQIYLNRR